MTEKSPYTIGFGRIPGHYIYRDLLIDDILENLNSEDVQGQA